MLMVPSTRGFVGKPGFLYKWPYFIAASQPTTYTKRTSLALAVPSGARQGDFLFAVLYGPSYMVGPNITPPAGWTFLLAPGQCALYYGFWDGVTTSPSWSWAAYGQIGVTGAMFVYRNVDPTYIWDYETPNSGGTSGFSAEENYASTIGQTATFDTLYAAGPNRTFVNAFFGFSPDQPQSLSPGGVYQPDSFVQPYVGYYMNAQPTQQARTQRTDNASYYANLGVADMFPCDTLSGALPSYQGMPTGYPPNAYLGDQVALGNAMYVTAYSNEDITTIALMLLPVGGLPGNASGGPR